MGQFLTHPFTSTFQARDEDPERETHEVNETEEAVGRYPNPGTTNTIISDATLSNKVRESLDRLLTTNTQPDDETENLYTHSSLEHMIDEVDAMEAIEFSQEESKLAELKDVETVDNVPTIPWPELKSKNATNTTNAATPAQSAKRSVVPRELAELAPYLNTGLREAQASSLEGKRRRTKRVAFAVPLVAVIERKARRRLR
jgi:hypothetical protein